MLSVCQQDLFHEAWYGFEPSKLGCAVRSAMVNSTTLTLSYKELYIYIDKRVYPHHTVVAIWSQKRTCVHLNSKNFEKSTLLVLRLEHLGENIIEYHSCWCPGSWGRQGIGRHVMDYVYG